MERQAKIFNDSEKYFEYVLELELQAKEALDKIKALSFAQKRKLINLSKDRIKGRRADYLGGLSISKKMGAIFESHSSEAQALVSLINTINLIYPT